MNDINWKIQCHDGVAKILVANTTLVENREVLSLSAWPIEGQFTDWKWAISSKTQVLEFDGFGFNLLEALLGADVVVGDLRAKRPFNDHEWKWINLGVKWIEEGRNEGNIGLASYDSQGKLTMTGNDPHELFPAITRLSYLGIIRTWVEGNPYRHLYYHVNLSRLTEYLSKLL